MPTVSPMDEHNTVLISHVHPPGWQNPVPDGCYNMVVIGAGTAGLITAAGTAGLGGKAALIERHLMGGDCLNVGCVPSKALISAAKAAHAVRHASSFGVRVPDGTTVDFPAVMERMRRLRAHISPADSAARYRDELGVDVFVGSARFTGPDKVEVGGQVLTFKRACIATGARAIVPDLPGLAEADPLTNESVFNLTELPPRMAVIGAGPIGCELAQAFQRFGSQVTVFDHHQHILAKEDADAASIVADALTSDGVRLVTGSSLTKVETRDSIHTVYYTDADGLPQSCQVESILVGAGRAPNVEDMGLDAAGVKFDTRHGIEVDDHLRTTNPAIYAAGDVASAHKFTHTADANARIVIQNALFFGRKKVSALTVPWTTYTQPEIAHVGLYPHQAGAQGIEIDTFQSDFAHLDRAILEGHTNGFVKIHVRKGSDTIVGATIVSAGAGDMISEISTAMAGGLGLGGLASVIHPYPTEAEAIKRVADSFNRTKLTPTVAKLMKRLLAWRRS